MSLDCSYLFVDQADVAERMLTTNPQTAVWLDCIYNGIMVVESDATRGTCTVGNPNGTVVDIPAGCVAREAERGVAISLEEALILGEEVCKLVGPELMLDFLYAKRPTVFYQSLYKRLLALTSLPAVVSRAMRVGRLDVYWTVRRGWALLLAEAPSPLFAVRAIETLADGTWRLTPDTATEVGGFVAATGLLAVRSAKQDADIEIDGRGFIYLPGRDKAVLSIMVLSLDRFRKLSWPELDRARHLLGRN